MSLACSIDLTFVHLVSQGVRCRERGPTEIRRQEEEHEAGLSFGWMAPILPTLGSIFSKEGDKIIVYAYEYFRFLDIR